MVPSLGGYWSHWVVIEALWWAFIAREFDKIPNRLLLIEV
jgi:hypothetical protein